MRLLIADDDDDSGQSLADLLDLFGHSCLVVQSGERAISEFRGAAFDAVFMDLKMPGIGGLRATREILAIDPGAKVIVTTGSTREELADVLSLPVIALLRKPFSADELTHALASCAD